MNVRNLILGLAVMASFLAGTSFADDPYVHKMPDPRGQRSSMRSYSVAPGNTGASQMVLRRNYGIRTESTAPHMLFRADRKIPGLYFTR